MNYQYNYIMEYLPKRYSATTKQKNDREIIYDFKNGYCSLGLINTIIEYIKEIKKDLGGNNWRVCFIPASTHHKTACRFQNLAAFIEKETSIPSDYNTILPKPELITQHMAIGRTHPAEDFLFNKEQIKGTDIILVGDIFITGTNFTKTCQKLTELGAKSVIGLFLAKSIHRK